MTNETGEILKALRLSRGLGQQQIADLVGAKSYTTVSKWESGENSPQGKDIKILSEFFKVSSDAILGIEHLDLPRQKGFGYNYLPTPISAGLPIEVDGITETDKINIPDMIMGKWARQKDIYIMRVNGDSMNKTIPHNSLIAVKPIELAGLKDKDIVVYSDNHEYSVKMYYNDTENKRIIFRPHSTDTRFIDNIFNYDETSNLVIHGKVVLWIVERD